VGLPARPQKAKTHLTCVSEMAYNAPKSGRMATLDYIEEWKKHPSVWSARPLVAAGELLTGPDKGMPTWHAPLPHAPPLPQPRARALSAAAPSPASRGMAPPTGRGVALWGGARYAEILVTFDSVQEGIDFCYAIDAQWRKEGGLPIVPV